VACERASLGVDEAKGRKKKDCNGVKPLHEHLLMGQEGGRKKKKKPDEVVDKKGGG